MTPEKSCISEFSINSAVINTAFYSDTMAYWQYILYWCFCDYQCSLWMKNDIISSIRCGWPVLNKQTADVQILLELLSMQPFLIWFLFEEVFYEKKSAVLLPEPNPPTPTRPRPVRLISVVDVWCHGHWWFMWLGGQSPSNSERRIWLIAVEIDWKLL